jgi:predicted dehydrogenase
MEVTGRDRQGEEGATDGRSAADRTRWFVAQADMSAVWTRFNPNSIAIQKALHDDQVIGDVTSLHTNLSLNAIGRRPDTDRVLAAELGGGALLDLGPYPWTWVSFQFRFPRW